MQDVKLEIACNVLLGNNTIRDNTFNNNTIGITTTLITFSSFQNSFNLEVCFSIEVGGEDAGLSVRAGGREEEKVARKLVVVFHAQDVADLDLKLR